MAGWTLLYKFYEKIKNLNFRKKKSKKKHVHLETLGFEPNFLN